MRTKLLILVVALVSLAAMAAIGQKKSTSPADATPVQEGVISDQQKQHSKLYSNYKGNGKLRDLIKKNPDGVDIEVLPGTPELSVGGRAVADDSVQELTSNADTIVVGRVTNKSSQITENGSFLFTDYEFSVDESLKNTTAAKIDSQKTITVTRPGGKVLLDGHLITATDRSFRELLIGGRYLLFLKFIPGTATYRPVNAKGSFDITNGKVELLTAAPDAQRIDKDAESFISDVRTAITMNKRGGGSRE